MVHAKPNRKDGRALLQIRAHLPILLIKLGDADRGALLLDGRRHEPIACKKCIT